MSGQGRAGPAGRAAGGRVPGSRPGCGSSTGTGAAPRASSTSWPPSAGCWSSARSRPGPASGSAARSRPSAGASGARLRRLAVSWLAAHGAALRRDPDRRHRAGPGPGRATSPSSTSAGWAECRWPAPTRSPWSGWRATRSRSRPTSRTAWSACCWSACRTRRCARRGTGSGRRSSTAASSGRSAGSRSACHRPACPSGAADSTSASPSPSWARRARSRRLPSTGWCSSASSGSTARCARSGGCCPPSAAAAAADFAGLPCRAPTLPRRRWSPGSGCSAPRP